MTLKFCLTFVDLGHIRVVNRQGSLHQETEIGIEIGIEIAIEREIEKETVNATEIANGIEIVTCCPDIDHQSDHLRGMHLTTFIIVQKTLFKMYFEHANKRKLNLADFKGKETAREIVRDLANLEMDMVLIITIRQLTIISSVIVNVIYHQERGHYRDIRLGTSRPRTIYQ